MTDRQLGVAALLGFIGMGGCALFFGLGIEPLGWPFAALLLGVGAWALRLGLQDYMMLTLTLMLVLLLVAGIAWVGSRIF